ncbi:TetR/AcrR family transcriptional regulator [Aeromicrobium sp. CF3.5]|uniref:TetR/AcrR family transcriptional regulator n=1 Tax=Aeromicrobium sp. CF3.5 TaxID=3373078 RepID=UPI003EE6E167
MTNETVVPERVTRAQRQAQTRGRLIDVARSMFLDDGYAATSLDKVAVRAGFSKGAVYSNFAGKEELCMAVLDAIHGDQINGVVEVFSGPGGLSDHIEAFALWARDGLSQPRWTALETEFGAIARHSTWVADSLRTRHREIRAAIEHLIREVSAAEDLRLPMPADRAATALLSMGIGLGALRSIDHDVDVTVFAEAMRALLREPQDI